MDFSEALVVSVKEVFSTMMGMDLLFEGNSVDIAASPPFQYTSMIGLAGEKSGLVYIYCDDGFAKKLTAAMLGMSDVPDDATILDALGELANLVGGNFKDKSVFFKDYQLSLPSVIVGSEFEIHTPGGKTIHNFFFRHDTATFKIQLNLKN